MPPHVAKSKRPQAKGERLLTNSYRRRGTLRRGDEGKDKTRLRSHRLRVLLRKTGGPANRDGAGNGEKRRRKKKSSHREERGLRLHSVYKGGGEGSRPDSRTLCSSKTGHPQPLEPTKKKKRRVAKPEWSLATWKRTEKGGWWFAP